MSPHLLTTAEAAALACRRPTTIRDWASRVDATGQRLLTPVDRDHRGRPLYDPRHVLAAEAAARRRDSTGRSWRALDTE